MRATPDFDRMYTEEGDPWKVGSSWYEQRKIAVVMACLADPQYGRCLDPACGTGHLARTLAGRCGEVAAYDASEAAIEVARRTCADAGNVRLDVRRIPYQGEDPGGPFDLVVLSEFLYYLDAATRRAAVDSVLARAADRFELLAVHWRDRPEDGTVSGDDAHGELRESCKDRGLRHQVAHFDEEFVLDVFTRGHDRHSD